jgi:hypothetical protein
MIVDFRSTPLSTLTGVQWRRRKAVSSSVYTSLMNRKWYTHTDSVVKKSQEVEEMWLSP